MLPDSYSLPLLLFYAAPPLSPAEVQFQSAIKAFPRMPLNYPDIISIFLGLWILKSWFNLQHLSYQMLLRFVYNNINIGFDVGYLVIALIFKCFLQGWLVLTIVTCFGIDCMNREKRGVWQLFGFSHNFKWKIAEVTEKSIKEKNHFYFSLRHFLFFVFVFCSNYWMHSISLTV